MRKRVVYVHDDDDDEESEESHDWTWFHLLLLIVIVLGVFLILPRLEVIQTIVSGGVSATPVSVSPTQVSKGVLPTNGITTSPLRNPRAIVATDIFSKDPKEIYLVVSDGQGHRHEAQTNEAAVFATHSGLVSTNQESPDRNCVRVTGEEFESTYCYVIPVSSIVGRVVKSGEMIGTIAFVTTFPPSLSYRLNKRSIALNPLEYCAVSCIDQINITPQEYLRVEVYDNLYSSRLDELINASHEALMYVSERVGVRPHSQILAIYAESQGCPLNGATYQTSRKSITYSCESIELQRAVSIMAHEYVHVLAIDRYNKYLADAILEEGFATWAAAKYWLNGDTDFRPIVRDMRNSGTQYPLNVEVPFDSSPEAKNIIYYQRASFVDFLINRYGRESFDSLYVSEVPGVSDDRHGFAGTADYVGIYGKSLSELETEWIAWLQM